MSRLPFAYRRVAARATRYTRRADSNARAMISARAESFQELLLHDDNDAATAALVYIKCAHSRARLLIK